MGGKQFVPSLVDHCLGAIQLTPPTCFGSLMRRVRLMSQMIGNFAPGLFSTCVGRCWGRVGERVGMEGCKDLTRCWDGRIEQFLNFE